MRRGCSAAVAAAICQCDDITTLPGCTTLFINRSIEQFDEQKIKAKENALLTLHLRRKRCGARVNIFTFYVSNGILFTLLHIITIYFAETWLRKLSKYTHDWNQCSH